MSALETSSVPKFHYQRLRHEGGLLEGDYHESERVVMKSRNWFRFRRVHIRRRFRLKVSSLRRVLSKKVRLVSALRVSCAKVLKRLKESQAHFGDLFAGNYLFVQVNPTSLKCIDKSCQNHNLDLQALPPNYSMSRVV